MLSIGFVIDVLGIVLKNPNTAESPAKYVLQFLNWSIFVQHVRPNLGVINTIIEWLIHLIICLNWGTGLCQLPLL